MSDVHIEADEDVTVCAECERACCWYGEFMCDNARDANIKVIKRSEVAARKRPGEHPCYWTDQAIADGGIRR
jgi:hypothetical protein